MEFYHTDHNPRDNIPCLKRIRDWHCMWRDCGAQWHHIYGLQPWHDEDLEKHHRDVHDQVEKSKTPWLSTGIGFGEPRPPGCTSQISNGNMVPKSKWSPGCWRCTYTAMVTYHPTTPGPLQPQPCPQPPALPFPSDLETFHITAAISRGEKGPRLALSPNLSKGINSQSNHTADKTLIDELWRQLSSSDTGGGKALGGWNCYWEKPQQESAPGPPRFCPWETPTLFSSLTRKNKFLHLPKTIIFKRNS